LSTRNHEYLMCAPAHACVSAPTFDNSRFALADASITH
jgi:hypothetical protein